MAGYNIEGKKVIISDDKYKEVYWIELSNLVKEKYFTENREIRDPTVVQEIFKFCFSFFCNKLEEKIQSEKRFSFYLFCHLLHEDSIDIFLMQTQGYKLSINEEKFAASRKILKIILEQSVKYDLNGAPHFAKEMFDNITEYATYLEEMLYIGEWAFISSEYLAKCQLFPKAIGVNYCDDLNEIAFLTYQPYPIFFSHIFKDLPNHESKVALSDCIDDFKNLIEEKYKVKYDDLCYFIAEIIQKPEHKFGVTLLSEIIKNIKANTTVDHNFIDSFYKGLTLNKDVALSIEECFYKNQDIRRHIYRPILEYKIDGKIFNIVGANKWGESMVLLTTNCFPFGIFPEEWKENIDLKKFIEKIDNTHDKIVQLPITNILLAKNHPYEIDIKSFATYNKQNINIDNTIGDIDILFLDIQNKRIYVCECKHNRSRFDYNNWKRDYSNFKSKYESQLNRKVEWVKQNIEVIRNHFKFRGNNPIDLDINHFEVIGIFLINAPTLYMYNSTYKCYTINDFERVLNNENPFNEFVVYAEDRKKTYKFNHPYFEDVERQL